MLLHMLISSSFTVHICVIHCIVNYISMKNMMLLGFSAAAAAAAAAAKSPFSHVQLCATP